MSASLAIIVSMDNDTDVLLVDMAPRIGKPTPFVKAHVQMATTASRLPFRPFLLLVEQPTLFVLAALLYPRWCPLAITALPMHQTCFEAQCRFAKKVHTVQEME